MTTAVCLNTNTHQLRDMLQITTYNTDVSWPSPWTWQQCRGSLSCMCSWQDRAIILWL